ncbi:arsenate reductase family protein [Patiriisocius hiemis]|uniref:ArsC/Spx/MgsR family protein n=1 Tax=Patiriisocius hiemis TaxID=3075604 RepID=A0ABU2YF45_9FLAO|nr:ArsC/Spx/MgsR family protein [Constantimarinum sp. W242]MDT0556496.1 ArsC/Spx/MgsR family protein [Constantimarinum sp. W242]
MNKLYHLTTCDTCKRIIKELNLPSSVEKQEIKDQEITVKQLDELKELAGSYEALFSKRAKLYKERNLKNETLSERDYKQFILEHYTFLKRPVLVYDNQIFIGNSKKVVAAAKDAIHS